MKNTLKLLSLIAMGMIIFYACSDENLNSETKNAGAEKVRPTQDISGRKGPDGVSIQTACGSFSGTYSGNGYYTYPDKVVSLCATAGGTITVYCDAVEVPDRFTIYDGNGNLIASTGWIGYATTSGPWGSSLNGPSTMTLSFAKGSTSSYKLRVETVTQGISDAWSADFGCNNVCVGGSITGSAGCGGSIVGSYNGVGSYTYSNSTIDVTSSAVGTYVTLAIDPKSVPNRVTVYNGATSLGTTGWIGTANYSGPWGSTLNNPGVKSLTFQRGSAATYTVKVETSTPSSTADDFSIALSCASCISSCGKGFSGTYSGNGYYMYPANPLAFCTTTNGKTISVSCNCVEVPNRFNIYDANGQLVASTGWIGYSSNSGPWGSSLNGPVSATMTFPKTMDNYSLKVETVTQGVSDAWDASVGCQP